MENSNLIVKINNGFCAIEKTITWVAFSIMLLLLVIQVVCRYCFNWPLAWAEEMVRYTYIGVSFLGATIAVREDSHICIDILPNIMAGIIKNKKKRDTALRVSDMAAYSICAVFWLLLAKWMFAYNVDLAEMNQITTCNEWSMWLMCLPLTVSCIMMGVHSILNVLERLINFSNIKKGGANG